MKCKVYDCDGYKIHTIKIDKYRTTTINISFRKTLNKEDISPYVILSRLLTYTSKKYPKKRDISVELERLYNSFIFSNCNIEGNTLNFEIIYDFLNPKYCFEGYLEEVIRFPFEILNHPNIKDNKFDSDSYNVCVNQFRTVIEEEKEYATGYAMRRCLECMDNNSPVSYSSLGYLDDLKSIDAATMVKTYRKLFTDFVIDIYVAGDIDMDSVVNNIKKNFVIRKNRGTFGSLFINTSIRKDINEVVEYGDYEQASFLMAYNMKDFTKRERDIVLPIYNSIFGGNELSSKLYMNVREKNSLCYNISSYFLKFGGVFVVRAGIDAKNKDKCISIVNKCMKEMINGKFSEEDILCAKKIRINQVKQREDSTFSLINIQIASDLDNALSGNKLINEYKTVTKKEIVALAKKIKLNTIYMLCKEGSYGKNQD